MYVAHKVRYL